MTINHSQTGTVPLLDHQTQTLTIEFICWPLPVVIITQINHQLWCLTPKSICHVWTNQMGRWQIDSQCLHHGTTLTPWRRFSLVSRMKWLLERSLLNPLMVKCSEQHDAVLDYRSSESRFFSDFHDFVVKFKWW